MLDEAMSPEEAQAKALGYLIVDGLERARARTGDSRVFAALRMTIS